jgi:hypothetical protein
MHEDDIYVKIHKLIYIYIYIYIYIMKKRIAKMVKESNHILDASLTYHNQGGGGVM